MGYTVTDPPLLQPMQLSCNRCNACNAFPGPRGQLLHNYLKSSGLCETSQGFQHRISIVLKPRIILAFWFSRKPN
jgi:hypothetical protein